MDLKGNNQGLLALIYNLVFYAYIKHIYIQHYYMCNKIVAKKIECFYISINKIIADSLTKPLIYVKFDRFI